jgi:hypothetical protein
MIDEGENQEENPGLFFIYGRLAFETRLPKGYVGGYKTLYFSDAHVQKVFKHFGFNYEV